MSSHLTLLGKLLLSILFIYLFIPTLICAYFPLEVRKCNLRQNELCFATTELESEEFYSTNFALSITFFKIFVIIVIFKLFFFLLMDTFLHACT